jgi:protein SDA1
MQGHFDCKLVLLQVLGRLINRHKLMVLGIYSFLQRYIHANQAELEKVLGVLVESTHSYLAKEELDAVVKHTID